MALGWGMQPQTTVRHRANSIFPTGATSFYHLHKEHQGISVHSVLILAAALEPQHSHQLHGYKQ